MKIPSFTCKTCKHENRELESNLVISQTAKDELDHTIGFNIKSVIVECGHCLTQKTLQVEN